jgi:predicted RNase H-like HicB family nuclease
MQYMATVYYPAIIERAADGYSVFFPDLPGCTSAGVSIQEAAQNAEQALDGHLLVSAEHGDEVAFPSELDAIDHDPEVEEVARLLVRAERPGRSVRLNITLDEGLVAAIDRVTPNRSGFLADAARAKLSNGKLAVSGHRKDARPKRRVVLHRTV